VCVCVCVCVCVGICLLVGLGQHVHEKVGGVHQFWALIKLDLAVRSSKICLTCLLVVGSWCTMNSNILLLSHTCLDCIACARPWHTQ
jgi:hypothetical protein